MHQTYSIESDRMEGLTIKEPLDLANETGQFAKSSNG